MMNLVVTGAAFLAGAVVLKQVPEKLLAQYGVTEDHIEQATHGLLMAAVLVCGGGLIQNSGLAQLLSSMVWMLFALAVLGGVVACFACRDGVWQLVSGFALQQARLFEPGDRVTVAGVTGVVVEIGLLHTMFVTPANECVFVPNSAVCGGCLQNHTRACEASPTPGLRDVAVPILLAANQDTDKALSVLERVAITTAEFVKKQNNSDDLKPFSTGTKTLASHHKERYGRELAKDQEACPPRVLIRPQQGGSCHHLEIRIMCDDHLQHSVAQEGYRDAVRALRDAGIELYRSG
eukprot:TRINITY_DN12388_c0_g1_i1.p1 TRINITY_DN12388_c0_g1~~TRINITY_DN12388_c0_g1_i1.p1  ORF type:complete len:292 (-),score=58.99 TRINITY_DN12388_c0_g1_i1:190-1065(-)